MNSRETVSIFRKHKNEEKQIDKQSNIQTKEPSKMEHAFTPEPRGELLSLRPSKNKIPKDALRRREGHSICLSSVTFHKYSVPHTEAELSPE